MIAGIRAEPGLITLMREAENGPKESSAFHKNRTDKAMQHKENNLKELEAVQKIYPFTPSATSSGMGWDALQAIHWRKIPASGEISFFPMSQHKLVLMIRPPEKMDLRYEGVKLDRPVPGGSILVMPAGSSREFRWQGSAEALDIYLDPSLVGRVTAEAFESDPTRTVIPPLIGLILPELRSAMLAVDAELRARGGGCPLLVESLATILSVHLIRHVTGRRDLPAPADGVLSGRKLCTVIEYIMENLAGDLTLAQMAAVAHLSPYHFARQFKAATGLSPYQYVISHRVERAQHLLRKDEELGLAEVALRSGFSDQSRFSLQFKRITGVTPRQFRILARDT
jgi:AraC family transcriptional regulator